MAISHPYPDILVFDFRDILLKYSPTANYLWSGYIRDETLRKFVQRFNVRDMIAANFINHYDTPSDSLLWEFVESKFPEGTGEFESSYDSLATFQLLADIITEEVEAYLKERILKLQCQVPYTDYLFDHWVTATSATFAHKDYDPAHDRLGERFGKL